MLGLPIEKKTKLERFPYLRLDFALQTGTASDRLWRVADSQGTSISDSLEAWHLTLRFALP